MDRAAPAGGVQAAGLCHQRAAGVDLATESSIRPLISLAAAALRQRAHSVATTVKPAWRITSSAQAASAPGRRPVAPVAAMHEHRVQEMSPIAQPRSRSA
jgi:hypothetical protein